MSIAPAPPPRTSPPAPATGRFAGLDGLRAIAVALVVVYHLFPQGWVQGGFIGVDVFFVVSGFLITSLLLRERARTGRTDLPAFWARRARRLLPALAVVVTVSATAAWAIGGDVLARLGSQVVGAATFSYNWVSVATEQEYFARDQPALFQNLWSLAVEEQFYLIWPLLFVAFLLLPGPRSRAGVALGVAAVSAAWMGVQVASGAGITRVYFGTDTHAFGLLLGVALAFALPAVIRRVGEDDAVRARVQAAGVLALVALLVLALRPLTVDAATFPGALLAASLLTVIAIAAAVWPGSTLGRRLDAAPLAWIGERSYGLYLWHWPVYVLVLAAAGLTGGDAPVPLTASLAALALSTALAAVSYRVVETPIRRDGFRGTARRLRRASGLAAALLLVGLVGGTGVAVAAAPSTTSAEDAVRSGMDAVREASVSASPTPTASAEPVPGVDGPPLAPGAPTPEPPDVPGTAITAIGDSVMLASAPGLLDRYPGIDIDAAVSRSMYAAPALLAALRDAGALRPWVVVGLGTNGPIEEDTLAEIRGIIGERRLVLVNAAAPRDWIAGVNGALGAFDARHGDVVVADWSAAAAAHPDDLAGDGIHPGPAGGRLYADAVATSIAAQSAEIERERRQWQDRLSSLAVEG